MRAPPTLSVTEHRDSLPGGMTTTLPHGLLGSVWQSPLPIEKCSAKTTVFTGVTIPNHVHSGVSLVGRTSSALFTRQPTGRKRIFYQA